MDTPKLKKFAELALSVSSQNLTPWAGVTTDDDVIRQTKVQAIEFTKLYLNKDATEEQLDKSAAELEALLKTQLVVSPPTKEKSQQLIEMLHDLIDNRVFPKKSE
jgi:hypothetical protein